MEEKLVRSEAYEAAEKWGVRQSTLANLKQTEIPKNIQAQTIQESRRHRQKIRRLFKGEALDEFGDMSFEQLRSLDRGETVPNNIAHETSRVSKEKSPSMSEKRVALETSRKKARPSTAVHSGRTLVSKPTLSTNLTIAVTKRDDEDKNSLSDLMKPDWYKFRPQTGRNRI